MAGLSARVLQPVSLLGIGVSLFTLGLDVCASSLLLWGTFSVGQAVASRN